MQEEPVLHDELDLQEQLLLQVLVRAAGGRGPAEQAREDRVDALAPSRDLPLTHLGYEDPAEDGGEALREEEGLTVLVLEVDALEEFQVVFEKLLLESGALDLLVEPAQEDLEAHLDLLERGEVEPEVGGGEDLEEPGLLQELALQVVGHAEHGAVELRRDGLVSVEEAAQDPEPVDDLRLVVGEALQVGELEELVDFLEGGVHELRVVLENEARERLVAQAGDEVEDEALEVQDVFEVLEEEERDGEALAGDRELVEHLFRELAEEALGDSDGGELVHEDVEEPHLVHDVEDDCREDEVFFGEFHDIIEDLEDEVLVAVGALELECGIVEDLAEVFS